MHTLDLGERVLFLGFGWEVRVGEQFLEFLGVLQQAFARLVERRLRLGAGFRGRVEQGLAVKHPDFLGVVEQIDRLGLLAGVDLDDLVHVILHRADEIAGQKLADEGQRNERKKTQAKTFGNGQGHEEPRNEES